MPSETYNRNSLNHSPTETRAIPAGDGVETQQREITKGIWHHYTPPLYNRGSDMVGLTLKTPRKPAKCRVKSFRCQVLQQKIDHLTFIGHEVTIKKSVCVHIHTHIYIHIGLPWWLSWSRIHLQSGRPGFSPWVGKIPWRRERLPTPVFWPGEFHGLYSPRGSKELDMTERLPLYSDIHTHTCIYTGNYLEESLKAGVCLKNCNQGL